MPKVPRKRRVRDPHQQREASRYAHPIASRELILDTLAQADAPLRFEQLSALLALHDASEQEALNKRLAAMQRDGQLFIDRQGAIGISTRTDLLHCRIIGHRDGYGFAHPLAGESDDLFLTARQMRSVMDGDEVLVSLRGTDSRGRPEGRVVEVLVHAHREVVGRYVEEGGIGCLIPHNPRITQQILIPPKRKGSAQHGQIVSVQITDYPTSILGGKGEVTEVLGNHLDPGLEIDVAIRAHGIPFEWSDAVLREAGALRDEPSDEDKQGRVDCRSMPFVTIDGEDARDFDDAVYCEASATGFVLWVAIADVSHYVRVGSALDESAAERGNSVYFPERVVPMFPEVLSNGLCSLKPCVDRLAMICEMNITREGELEDFQFYEGVIHSAARLTYTQVGAALSGQQESGVPDERLPEIQRLHALYRVLRAARDRRGAIDFETVETRVVINEARKIESIEPVVRNDAHKLIEESMLIANVATALFLAELDVPALYRVHEGPSADRLENLRAFLGELRLELAGGLKPTPEHYQRLLATLADRDDASVIQTMMLRSLSQAVYQPENLGHFGLHYEAYAHFTSPIRRYPDLLVHRAIRQVIRSKAQHPHVRRVAGVRGLKRATIYPYSAAQMAALGEQCSMTERRADDATREVDAWLKCEFLSERVGEVFEGVVAAVTSFGLFVELGDLYIEGLLHISALPGDYYHFEAARQRLIGERTRKVFALGAKVRVQIAQVDLDARKIDLALIGTSGGQTTSRAPGKNKAAGSGRSNTAHRTSDAGTRSKQKKKPQKSKTKGKAESRERKQGSGSKAKQRRASAQKPGRKKRS